MKWIRERDALIAQTMAFVQSVTGRKDDLLGPDAPSDSSAATVAVEAVMVEIKPPQPPPQPQLIQLSPQRAIGDFRTEMQARIANFRKHQERFEREREEYCAETLTKLRAALRDAPGPLAKK
ncbi:hypothetical protein XH99_19270 [Bradyrhizobium nanningense]|uniref:Uncharacterized protein n=2 Tax=Nitrobacteraceae TaxID=41294 RepID=A0A4Q0S372_9BRAD|nr:MULTISPECIES: hypothetical protein [Bradyrhizobium]RXH21998.1 hypothetical protein XH84_36535 [Bradyrhizobium nanningense]RXH26517.1 hypothetical protein XH99_19270 [Bradyrhizobium nanningense]TQF29393.1 hypothetical protein UNPA324_06895 [Bradyrhizobium sp. UNPA324]